MISVSYTNSAALTAVAVMCYIKLNPQNLDHPKIDARRLKTTLEKTEWNSKFK